MYIARNPWGEVLWKLSALLFLRSRLAFSLLAAAQSQPATPAKLMPGFGDHHHPVATANPEAQKFFDQGLVLSYGFNHDEAERSFRRAAELDPKMAMAWWGVAYVIGPNYNMPVDPEHEQHAYEAIQKAIVAFDERLSRSSVITSRLSPNATATSQIPITRSSQSTTTTPCAICRASIRTIWMRQRSSPRAA